MKQPIRAGLCSVSFRDNSPLEIIRAAKDAGLSAIEWGSDVHVKPGDLAAARLVHDASRDAGIAVSSLGSYFRLGVSPLSDVEPLFELARTLGTDTVRIWAGDKGSARYTAQERKNLVTVAETLAKSAEKEKITLALEYHRNTLTDTAESAVSLLSEVGSSSFRAYWQPNPDISFQENLAEAALVAPYACRVHVFHWLGDGRYPLADGAAFWKKYLALFDLPYALLEFMPDAGIETLPREAAALAAILNAL